jgi:hypothetical protein
MAQRIFVEEVTLYKVKIEHMDEYFETPEAAIQASAMDGQNLIPTPVEAFKLSDGRFFLKPRLVGIHSAPNPEEFAEFFLALPKDQMNSLVHRMVKFRMKKVN